MNDLATTINEERAGMLAKLEAMSVADLKQNLADCLRVTAADMLKLALIVHVLEAKGENLDAMKMSLLYSLRKVACGQVLPEVLVRFGGNDRLLRLVANLPIQDQHKLARGEPLPLLVFTPNGANTTRMVNPLIISTNEREQLFDTDHIRNEAEQALYLDRKRQDEIRKQKRQKNTEIVGKFRVDRERGGAVAGRVFYATAELEAVVRALKR